MSSTKFQTLTTAATLAVIAGSILGSVSAAPLVGNGNKQLLRRGQNQSTLGGGSASPQEAPRPVKGAPGESKLKPDSQNKPRDLAELFGILEARDVDELVELFGRGKEMSKLAQKAVKDTAQTMAQNAGESAIKNAVSPPQQPLPKDAQDAIKKA